MKMRRQSAAWLRVNMSRCRVQWSARSSDSEPGVVAESLRRRSGYPL